jgi:hypothetical protein
MRFLILIALPVIITIAVYSAAFAGPLEDGRAAHDRGDYQTTLKLLQPLADQGNAEAQDKIGDVYENGKAVPQNYVEAVKWYRKAADQGNADGQADLGSMYSTGHGVPQDYAEAVQWFRKAADQGHAGSQALLGFMYEKGQGVPKDDAEAAKWYRKAADQGIAGAQVMLGSMYEEDRIQHESGGSSMTPENTVRYLTDKDYARSILQQEKENQQADRAEAAKWYLKASEKDNARAELSLGNMYANGQGVAQDDTEAAKWYRKAAEQGDQNAQQILGWKYEQGKGVTQDFVEAYAWDNAAGGADASDRMVKYIPSSRLPEARALANKYSSLYNNKRREQEQARLKADEGSRREKTSIRENAQSEVDRDVNEEAKSPGAASSP